MIRGAATRLVAAIRSLTPDAVLSGEREVPFNIRYAAPV